MMVDKIIFPSYSAVISMEGENSRGQNVVIPKDSESHVSDKPLDFNIKANEVVRYPHERGGIDLNLLSATGAVKTCRTGQYNTEEWHKNHRSEIVLVLI